VDDVDRVAPSVARALGLKRGKARRWIKLLVLGVVLVGAAVLAVQWWRARSVGTPTQYVTADVTRGDVRVTISATGTVEALNTVEVGAEVSGRITKLYVDYNDHVEKGQVLAEIDRTQLLASADEAAAHVAAQVAVIQQAEATLAEADATLTRVQAQAEYGLASKADLDTAKASQARAKAALAAAKANAVVTNAGLKTARNQLGKTQVVSPTSGVVLSRLVENGQTVTAGFSTPVLFKIAEDLRRMSLHVYVDEADVGRVKEGQEATFTVDAFPGRTFPAKLVSLRNEPKTEQNVVSYEAVLSVTNDELLLRPGMTATAAITCDEVKDVLLVPNAALRFSPPVVQAGGGLRMPGPPPGGGQGKKPAGPTVYVLEGTTLRPVLVKVGVSDGTSTEVTAEGLAVGAKVATDTVEKAKK
jgi:HlyD family secretion protein